jgi:hypothetical protein
MVAGIYVLEQAEKRNLFRVDDRYPGRPFAFSHLYTALTRPGYRTFLGLSEDWRDSGPEPDPVPDDKLDNLKNVMHWLFGSKQDDIKPIVVSQNPNVKELGEVLANAKARAVLMTKGDLRIAYTEVETPALQFEKSLVEAHLQVENSLKKISAYNGVDETLYKVATEIQDNSNVIVSVMNSARKSTRDKSR